MSVKTLGIIAGFVLLMFGVFMAGNSLGYDAGRTDGIMVGEELHNAELNSVISDYNNLLNLSREMAKDYENLGLEAEALLETHNALVGDYNSLLEYVDSREEMVGWVTKALPLLL